MSVIRRVYEVVRDRKENPREDSYVCALLREGEDRILQKFGEEAVEAILAAKSGKAEALVAELADVVFHGLVLLGDRGIAPERIEAELERRFGTSGLAEKAARRSGE